MVANVELSLATNYAGGVPQNIPLKLAQLSLTTPLMTHQSQNTSRIDDPTPITTVPRFLTDHLFRSIFTAEEDAFGVYAECRIPCFFGEIPDWRGGAAFEGDAGVVYHSGCTGLENIINN